MCGIRLRNLLTTCALLLALAPVADAATITLEAFSPSQGKFGLSGSDETPPNTSRGMGLATFTLDTTALTLISTVNFQSLGSGATASQIQMGDPGVAGPVIHPYTLPTSVVGQTSGAFFDVWSASTPTMPLTQALITQIVGGHTYINIDSTSFPGGEIRGQIVVANNVIPEPSSLVLSTLGAVSLLGLAALRRRLKGAGA